ncbi:MAG: cytochrome c [Myxococcota bacterium]
MDMVRTLVVCLVALSAGCFRPYEHDPIQVNERYTLKYKEPCSAWLRSPKTGYLYCSSPAFTVEAPGAATAAAAPTFTSKTSGETDEASLKAHGEQVYGAICTTCHQADGKGTPGAFPPLAGSGSFYGDPKNHAKIIVNGLSGAITVQGVAFNGVMPPQGSALSDYDIAAVATFERLSWGNNDGIVLPEDVASVR